MSNGKLINVEVYDAFRSVGIEDQIARKAASAITSSAFKDEFAAINKRLDAIEQILTLLEDKLT
jgi:hypothetical protein